MIKARSETIPRSAGRPAKAWSRKDLAAAGLDQTFISKRINIDGVKLHIVSGGNGPALLLVPGWPQTWYGWRRMIPELAKYFTVVAVDPRGIGGSDAPLTGYDLKTVGGDLHALMNTLGHEAYHLVGTDVGTWIAYAMASDYDSVLSVTLTEAIIPGLVDGPPLFIPSSNVNWAWHFAFNRADTINEQLVSGREELFLGNQFDVKLKIKDAISPADLDLYARSYKSPDHLRASFDYYRAFDQHISQNKERSKTKLRQPVLAVGGEFGVGARQEAIIKPNAETVTGAVLPGAGHYPAEETPDAFVKALLNFLSHLEAASPTTKGTPK